MKKKLVLKLNIQQVEDHNSLKNEDTFCWDIVEIGTFQDVQTDVKSAAILVFKFWSFEVGMRISNELLFIIIVQVVTKLWTSKVGGLKKIIPRAESNPFLLSKSRLVRQFFHTS